MSSSGACALLSATFHEDGYDHLVELVHQRDADARRRLRSLDISIHDADGKLLAALPGDPGQEILDLGALVTAQAPGPGRRMVLFDARYDERVFPYRPHHYAYLHRRGSDQPSLYYAINAVLGGVPDRIGATGLNNFETYLFLPRGPRERHSVLLGNPSRFAAGEAQVATYYARSRHVHEVRLDPKAHLEVALEPEREGARLERVEIKAVFKLASYVVGRRAPSDELVLFDHLFSYFT
jgi:hypothetical protein